MTWVWRLCWKEYREQQLVWIVMAVGTAVVVGGVAAALGPLGGSSLGADPILRDTLTTLVLVMAIAYSAVCGGMLFAGETENRTQTFLNVLPVSRGALWLAKTLFGLALVIGQTLVLFGIVAFYQLGFEFHPGMPWYGFLNVLLIVTIAAYFTACLTSSFCATVLQSVGLTALLLPVGACTWGMFVPVALVASRQIYCRQDRQRRSRKTGAKGGVRGPSQFVSVAWLCWRQGRTLILILVPAAVITGVAWPSSNVLVWPVATWLIGVACGTAVFAGEQIFGAERFLGEQRFSRRWLWSLKTGFWLAVAGCCAGIVWIVGMVALRVAEIQVNEYGAGTWYLLMDRGAVSSFIEPVYYLTLWLVYGFTIALFFTQILHKPVVALVVSLMISAMMFLAWWPSLVCGGLQSWQVFAPPLVLLAASYWLYRPWVSGRLFTPRLVLAMTGTFVLIVAWIAGNLWYRSVEVPEIPEPFDRQAFLASLPSGEKNQAGEQIRDGLERMEKHTDTVIDDLWQAKTDVKEQAFREKESAFQKELDELLTGEGQEGKTASPMMVLTLDQIFDDSWDADLRKAVRLPLGMLLHPNQATFPRKDQLYSNCSTATLLWRARATQMMEQQRYEDAWTYLHSSLLLAHQTRSHADDTGFFYGIGRERATLETLNHLLAQIKDQPMLLRRILSALNEHDRNYPPLAETVKANIVVWDNIREPFLTTAYGQKAEYKLFQYARLTPWEKERDERLLRILAASQLWLAEQQKPWELARTGIDIHGVHISDDLGLDYEGSPGKALSENWLRQNLKMRDEMFYPYMSVKRMIGLRTQQLQKLRQTQLLIAQALYETGEGHPPQQPADLVPKYLPAIPTDPTTGQPFTNLVQWEEKKAPE